MIRTALGDKFCMEYETFAFQYFYMRYILFLGGL